MSSEWGWCIHSDCRWSLAGLHSHPLWYHSGLTEVGNWGEYYSEIFLLWGGSQLVLVGGEQFSPALWGGSGLYPTSLLFQIHMKLLGVVICFVHIGQGMIDMQIKSSKTSLQHQCLEALRIWMARTDCVLTLLRLNGERFSNLQIWELEAFHLSDLMWNMVILLNSQFLLEEQVTAIRSLHNCALCTSCIYSWTKGSQSLMP